MHDGLIEVLLFVVGLVAGWVLTTRSKPSADTAEKVHTKTVKAETKRLKAKTALAEAKHKQTIKLIEKKQNKLNRMTARDLAAKVRDLFGGDE